MRMTDCIIARSVGFEKYPIEVYPIVVYPIEVYPIGSNSESRTASSMNAVILITSMAMTAVLDQATQCFCIE